MHKSANESADVYQDQARKRVARCYHLSSNSYPVHVQLPDSTAYNGALRFQTEALPSLAVIADPC